VTVLDGIRTPGSGTLFDQAQTAQPRWRSWYEAQQGSAKTDSGTGVGSGIRDSGTVGSSIPQQVAAATSARMDWRTGTAREEDT
jgi:hypothetical protein